MTDRKKSAKSKLSKFVGALTETIWTYGVGAAAARPLPVGHVYS